MSRRNFRIVVFSLLGAGLAVMIVSLCVDNGGTKKVLLSLTGAFYLAAAIQIIVYKKSPRLFDDKKTN